MRLKVEFTTEPFALDGFPGHASAARRAVSEAGLTVDVGPFGTTAEGEAAETLGAVARLLQDALAGGATRISLQVSALGTDPKDADPTEAGPTDTDPTPTADPAGEA